ncbi:MAG: ABC transporter permease subunit [Armatimonadota bacterium]
MLQELIAKELKDSLVSLRFVVGLLFVITIYAAGSVLFCKKFDNQMQSYQQSLKLYATALESAKLGINRLFDQVIPITMEPHLAQLFASGNETRYPRTIEIRASAPQRGRSYAGVNPEARSGNYKLSRYRDFDWAFFVGVVLSFIAIVMSFDAISRERETGTLRLQLSTRVLRSQILFAKYISILVLLFVPIAIGSLLSITVVLLLSGHNILVMYPLEFVFWGALSFLYLSLFVWLGLWLSSSVSRSATSLTILFLLWIFFVDLGPYLGGMIAGRFYPVASKEAFERQFLAALNEMLTKAPKEYYEFYAGKESEEGWQAIEGFFQKSDQTLEALTNARFADLYNQALTAERFNLLSPYWAFRTIAETVSNTGLVNYKKFYEDVRRYRYQIREFIRDRDLADPGSKHRLYPLPKMRSISSMPVDPKSIPLFLGSHPDVPHRIEHALPAICELLILNIITFLFALHTFSRMDVR